jgi:acyl-coenzyme A thioesterase PaaI-like protein
MVVVLFASYILARRAAQGEPDRRLARALKDSRRGRTNAADTIFSDDSGWRARRAERADFLRREFPQTRCLVEAVGDGTSTVSHEITVHELRPGGTVSGPVLMSVADIALYVAIFGKLGIIPLAVTTSLTINFLRRPARRRNWGGAHWTSGSITQRGRFAGSWPADTSGGFNGRFGC